MEASTRQGLLQASPRALVLVGLRRASFDGLAATQSPRGCSSSCEMDDWDIAPVFVDAGPRVNGLLNAAFCMMVRSEPLLQRRPNEVLDRDALAPHEQLLVNLELL